MTAFPHATAPDGRHWTDSEKSATTGEPCRAEARPSRNNQASAQGQRIDMAHGHGEPERLE